MDSSKARAVELMQRLRDAARQQDPVAKSAVDLVKHLYDTAKDSLVTSSGDDMLRLQGEARAFKRLHNELTTVPPSIKPE